MISSRRRAPGTWCSRAPRRTRRAIPPCPAAGSCASRPCSRAWGSSGQGTRIGAPGRARSTTWRPRARNRARRLSPRAARPRQLSVSDIGLWMKDPYDLYAKRILELAPLEALEADPGPLERGNVSTRRWNASSAPIRASCPPTPSAACSISAASCSSSATGRRSWRCGGRASSGSPPGWSSRSARAARVHRDQGGGQRAAPARRPAGEFRLKARADRLERHADGRITVIDYKTGLLPERTEVLSGRAPAAARGRDGRGRRVRRGRTRGGGRAPVLAAARRRSRRRGEARGRLDPAALAAQARDGLARLIAHYDRRETPIGRAPAGRGMAGRLRPSGAARRMDLVSPPAAARRLPPTAAQRRAADPPARPG